jgi:DoxX-like family
MTGGHESRRMLWAGWILSGLPASFLLVDGVMKLIRPTPVVETTVKLGYPASVILAIGLVLMLATILYIIPRTAVLGAILLTGYLGGAVATHVRVSGGWFPILFPIALGILLWAGLWFRSSTLRSLLPLRK